MKPCRALVHYDNITGAVLPVPRPCRKEGTEGGLCPAHHARAERASVAEEAGGWCVWCGEPGARFTPTAAPQAVPVTLCAKHGRALRRALLHLR